ncbi:hypothetical protein EW146_g2642 [Bondarzewia mesenterica]|uniref:Uncharacterized protein n=1 Tax=Bondarzewia mesenterica TaxID=1095465 RepID=A0A4V3XFP8_9AGAM|nr:hypothetical protein EW146_g2642 [Bondarzewia mesenterica]
MAHRILVASYTNSIYTLSFDPATPSLELISSVEVGHHPSWITPHPEDPSVVFAGLEQTDGRVVVLKYDEQGQGKVIGEFSSGGKDPASLLAVEGTLFVGNYSSGTILSAPITTHSPFFSQSESMQVQLSGTGLNAERQEASHPHQVVFIPERGELLVPDLGADKTWRLMKNDKGAWVPVECVEYEPGSGPRHVVFHHGILYTLCELTSKLAAHRLPPLPASPTTLSTTSTISNPPNPLGEMLAAELLLSASAEPLLYASNRNDPSLLGDSIAIFSLSDHEAPKLINEVRTGLRHVRGMQMGLNSRNKWLITGGVHGGGVKVYEKVEDGKDLREIK